MLHVGAQGDQPSSVVYFVSAGLDINAKDKKRSTPLHWAAFAGAELALSYILAYDIDVNAQDTKGYTALHLAVKASEDLRSTRSIRHLLIKGADKTIKVRNLFCEICSRISKTWNQLTMWRI